MPSKLTSTLATFLFVSHAPATEFATNPDRTRELIHQTADRLGPDGAARAVAEFAEFAYEYGEHPETAAAFMRTCLQAVEAANVEIPVPAPRTAVTR